MVSQLEATKLNLDYFEARREKIGKSKGVQKRPGVKDKKM